MTLSATAIHPNIQAESYLRYMLHQHRTRHLQHTKKTLHLFSKQGGLFHYKKLNHRLDRLSAAIDKEIKAEGTANGLTAFPHIHSHIFRHTFATRMREAGADVKATAEIMGHTEVELTLNTYIDASEEFKRQEIALLDVIDAKRAI